MTGSPVFVSTEAAASVFEWADAVAALQAAYAEPPEPASLPPRTVGRSGGSWLRTLPALPGGSRYFGAKLMGMTTVAPSPGVEYVIVLFDRETSRIAAFVDGNEVTAYRT
jgi:ornithine cyclodeaminase/alanine dehydrogenase